jgi:DNA-binding response OmpR family regulator
VKVLELSRQSVKGACRPALSSQSALAFPRLWDDNSGVVREVSPVVLVVEDDSAVRQPLVKFLQMRQYTVVTAETADEGLDAIKTHRPAAAIIDLRLRRGSGREVVVSTPPGVPVIIFSGLRSESADLETLRPNTRLVEKPYSLVMLMDTLEDMLEESKGNQSGFGRIAAS